MAKIIYLDNLRGGTKFMACVDIEQKAKELLKEHGLYTVPVDPIKLAESLNVEILKMKTYQVLYLRMKIKL